MYPACSAIYFPTPTLPVNVIKSILGFWIISNPISSGQPVTTENISGGKPASYNISANNIAVIGVNSVCLQTVQLLVAIEGAILCATIFKGWLKGVIAEIAVRGSRIVKIFLAFPCGVKSHENISPSS